jgi:hypothetical protein
MSQMSSSLFIILPNIPAEGDFIQEKTNIFNHWGRGGYKNVSSRVRTMGLFEHALKGWDARTCVKAGIMAGLQ